MRRSRRPSSSTPPRTCASKSTRKICWGLGQVAVQVTTGGICGSDLHYYNHGGFGTIRLKEPMILGHEVAGHITALGEGVAGLRIGQLVGVSPSRPCYGCRFCHGRPVQPVPQHAVLWLCHALPAYPGRISRGCCGGCQPVRRGRWIVIRRGRYGGTPGGDAACNAARGRYAGQIRFGDGLRAYSACWPSWQRGARVLT